MALQGVQLIALTSEGTVVLVRVSVLPTKPDRKTDFSIHLGSGCFQNMPNCLAKVGFVFRSSLCGCSLLFYQRFRDIAFVDL